MNDEQESRPGLLLQRSAFIAQRLFSRAPQACLLVYDGQCRLCVTAKQGLERLRTHPDATPIRMVPYHSEEAKQALGAAYRPGRPDVAFLVRPNGEIAKGLDAFLVLLPGLRGGRVLSTILRLPLVKLVAYLLYWLVARYRYQVFGTVSIAGVPEDPGKPRSDASHQ